MLAPLLQKINAFLASLVSRLNTSNHAKSEQLVREIDHTPGCPHRDSPYEDDCDGSCWL